MCSGKSSDLLWLHKESLIKLRIELTRLFSSIISSIVRDHVFLSKSLSVNFCF